ncbi:MAG: aminoacyl-tRNA hydrolase [Eubacterium sp.]|nr:aminoacyl-tRNA hydrolase [Eubacterium sp.]
MNTNRIFARFVDFFRHFKVKENQITLIEKLDTHGTGSLYSLRDECERRGLPFSYNVITQEDYQVRPGNIFGLVRLFTLKAYRMAVSSHIFLNDNFMPLAYMHLSPETKVVQLWHGMGSYKKFGGSEGLPEDLLGELKAVGRNVTHVLASSVNIRENYAEAFCVPPEKVLVIGCPQADYYFRHLKGDRRNLKAARSRLEEYFPRLKGKKLALYAPTFRDDKKRDRELLSHFDFDSFDRECGKEYCLAVRLHPQVHGDRVPDSVIDLTGYPNIRELLMLTDLLIADYSSIAVEYALLDKPILIYAFDKDWYLKKDRGFYFDFEETAPGPVLTDMDALIGAVKAGSYDPERARRFARLHNDYYDDLSAARVVDYYWGKDTAKKMKIIAGLGNPTDEYKGTRHNVGFMAIDAISKEYKIPVNQHKYKAMTGTGFIGGQRVLLLKPLTYMNLSGQSLRAAMDFYKADLSDLLVIYDDISLEPGMLRIRKKGSAGGHNGMKDIIRQLGGDTFPRIRIGIGGEKHPDQDLADYVLGRFPKEELALVEDAVGKAVKASELIVLDEIDEAMNRYSVGKKKRTKTENEDN